MSRRLALQSLRRISFAAITVAVAGCGMFAPQPRLPAEDAQFAESSSAAMIAFDQGDVETAVQLYQRALKRAHAMDNAQSIAVAAYNLAACEITLNRYQAAGNHLEEAKYNCTKNSASLNEIQLLTAKLAYLRSQDAAAQEITEPLCKSQSQLIQLQARILRTLIACDVGNLTLAKFESAQVSGIALKLPDAPPAVLADVEKAEGTVAKIERQPHVAADYFDRETDLLRSAHRYRDMIHSLSRSGSAHDEAGEVAAAANRYYRAALASSAIEDQTMTKEFAEKALAAAKAADDTELTSMIEHLIGESPAATAP